MKLTIKGLKTFAAEDGMAFRCTVLVDGAARFRASNDGNGGCNLYTPLSGQTWAAVREAEAWAKAQPQRALDLFEDGRKVTVDCDLDLILSDLIDEEQDRKWLKRQCARKTVYRTPDAKPGEWMVVDAPFSEAVQAWVLKREPRALFANGTV